jgi:hypothetical protein
MDFFSMLEFSAFTLLWSIVLNYVIIALLNRVRAHVRSKLPHHSSKHSDVLVQRDSIGDEFADLLKWKNKVLLAARLTKMRRLEHILDTNEREANFLLLKARKDMEGVSNTPKLPTFRWFEKKNWILYEYDVATMESQYQAVVRESSFVKVVEAVSSTRMREVSLASAIARIPINEQREALLMKSFIVDCLERKSQSLAQYLIQRDDGRIEAVKLFELSRCLAMSVSFWMLFAYTLLVSYYLVITNPSIGNRSSPCFVAIFLICVAVDGLILETASLYAWWILLINRGVGQQLYTLLDRLKTRARIVLIRSRGILRDFSGKSTLFVFTIRYVQKKIIYDNVWQVLCNL